MGAKGHFGVGLPNLACRGSGLSQRLRIHQPLEENPRSRAVMGARSRVSHPPAGKDT